MTPSLLVTHLILAAIWQTVFYLILRLSWSQTLVDDKIIETWWRPRTLSMLVGNIMARCHKAANDIMNVCWLAINGNYSITIQWQLCGMLCGRVGGRCRGKPVIYKSTQSYSHKQYLRLSWIGSHETYSRNRLGRKIIRHDWHSQVHQLQYMYILHSICMMWWLPCHCQIIFDILELFRHFYFF